MPSPSTTPGITLRQHAKTLITHLGNPKSPFTHLSPPIPVTMHELCPQTPIPFIGQCGLIDFDVSVRLPRHVHIAPVEGASQEGGSENTKQHFTTERILVLNGIAMVELNAEIYVIPPRTLVTIAPGVPHTWTACPAGVDFEVALTGARASAAQTESATATRTVRRAEEEGVKLPVSDGTFLMVYEYEDVTGFYPTRQTETLNSVAEYVRCEEGGLEAIRFPVLGVEEVYGRGVFVWGERLWWVER